MPDHYILEPEVAGELGPSTLMETNVHPPIIHKLEFLIQGWLGDCLLETFPVFMITETAANKLESENFSGFELDELTLIEGDNFREWHPDLVLPKFYWLKVTGELSDNDFGIIDNRLAVSEKVLNILREEGIENCDVENGA